MSREKVKVADMIENEKVIDWLISLLQKSMHCCARVTSVES